METEVQRVERALKTIQVKAKGYNLMAFYEIDRFKRGLLARYHSRLQFVSRY